MDDETNATWAEWLVIALSTLLVAYLYLGPESGDWFRVLGF